MKSLVKTFVCLMSIMLFFSSAVSLAAGKKNTGKGTDTTKGNADSSAYWQKQKDDQATAEPASQIQEKATPLLNAYIWFGYAIALGMVVFIGIKYMTGAADARANMKSAIVGWLIGAFIVFMSTTIVGIVLKRVSSDKNPGVKSMANDIVSVGYELAE